MENREWRNVEDKTKWERGPWDDEPDKAQWTDEATGLPCLIVRGPAGALCGYVGVSKAHPLYGKEYSACASEPACLDDNGEPRRWGCGHAPDERFNCHGGLTFSGACREASRERFEKLRDRITSEGLQREAEKFPRGDAAEMIRRFGPMVNDFDAWVRHCESADICHIGGDFEPAWWFGFDCAHAWDATPGSDARMRSIGHGYDRDPDEAYRDFDYVRSECTKLAQQLANA